MEEVVVEEEDQTPDMEAAVVAVAIGVATVRGAISTGSDCRDENDDFVSGIVFLRSFPRW